MRTVYGQISDGDLFFLDMGVMIESKNKLGKPPNYNSPNFNYSYNNPIAKNSNSPIFMATSSDLITSIDKINKQVQDIEESFRIKVLALEAENSRLRNQVVVLNKKLYSELSSDFKNNISSLKPINELPIPNEETINKSNIVCSFNSNNKFQQNEFFNKDSYISGVIAYKNEEYEQCIEYFKPLSIENINVRTASNILIQIADSYEKIGRYKQALKNLNRLKDLNNNGYMDLILAKKGSIYKKIGFDSKANMCFSTLLSEYPQSKYFLFAEEASDI